MTAQELKQAISDYQKQLAAEYTGGNPFNKSTHSIDLQNALYLENRDLYFGLRNTSDNLLGEKDKLRNEFFALKAAFQRGLI